MKDMDAHVRAADERQTDAREAIGEHEEQAHGAQTTALD
jgi:hypothetical protein